MTATRADSCARAERGGRAKNVCALPPSRGAVHWSARAGAAVGLFLVTACRALLDYEPAPTQVEDGGSGGATLGGGAGDGPRPETGNTEEAGDAGVTAPPASLLPPTASAGDRSTPQTCTPDSSPDVRETCCAEYCDLFYPVCSDLPAVGSYTSSIDCADRCYTSGWPLGTASERGSIACRYWHSNLAAAEEIKAAATPLRELHCGHAGEVPTDGGC